MAKRTPLRSVVLWWRRTRDELRQGKSKDYVRTELPAPADGFTDSLGRLDPNIETVFDVGANVGDMTLHMLEVFPRATVYSFEPCSSTFEELRRRVEASPHRERVILFKHGFFDERCTRTLHVTSHHGANSLLEITPEYHELNPHVQERSSEDIALRRLDDFVLEMGIGQIDLLKIDVEGAETQVLAGGRETLKSKVGAVFCEVSFVRHPKTQGEFIELFRLMHECGFAPAEVYDVAHGSSDTAWRLAQFDCVFRRFDA